jgi:hypothetical protein
MSHASQVGRTEPAQGSAEEQTPAERPRISEALRHCYGIGPIRLAELHESGIRCWNDVIEQVERVPTRVRETVVAESHRCLAALEANQINYFLGRFIPQDRWRVLDHYRERASFFDIETTGLEYDSQITVICCYHRFQLHTFVENENLDDFLDLIDDVELLVSFNGSTFDVPRVLDGFHIPKLPCPHLDLRWPCYHRGFLGSLKSIAEQLSITRPHDLQDADGALAVRLWEEWVANQDEFARDRLVRYCASDVLLLALVSDALVSDALVSDALVSDALAGTLDEQAAMWSRLPGNSLRHDRLESPVVGRQMAFPNDQAVAPEANAPESPVWSPPTVVGHFGAASPQKLRGRRHVM